MYVLPVYVTGAASISNYSLALAAHLSGAWQFQFCALAHTSPGELTRAGGV